ncbi:ribonuclease P protein component [Streptococcus saliviloxodontae]|uniref:Ribonuclease P protein component n=1 Tax=Streptococcus saliviloxodontae TaxID=1349416 RepID=A0ABS2PJF1_9STRE|nr:ribonuclease P protein component [Streptococcus saliviloxodontae]MBM7635221.1 ribonuclease P protein component [Streptococcus saliviloxodontae]
MKKTYRVKRDKDFQAIFNSGRSSANRRFVVYSLKSGQPHYRLGLSVSKKLGNAVMRNKIKRRLRHLIKGMEGQLVTEDFVIIARKGVEKLTYQEMESNLLHVLKLAKVYQEGSESEKEN